MSSWPAVLAVVLAAALAGCARPLASGEEPDRASVALPRNEVSGELLRLEGSMRVSLVPGEAWAAADPDQPTNCLDILDADEDSTSFLGGLILDLAWNATAGTGEELVAVVEGPGEPGRTTRVEAQGGSPLHLVLNESATQGSPIRTPLRVTLAVPAGDLPAVDLPVAWTIQVGILESRIAALQWAHCSPLNGPLA